MQLCDGTFLVGRILGSVVRLRGLIRLFFCNMKRGVRRWGGCGVVCGGQFNRAHHNKGHGHKPFTK